MTFLTLEMTANVVDSDTVESAPTTLISTPSLFL